MKCYSTVTRLYKRLRYDSKEVYMILSSNQTIVGKTLSHRRNKTIGMQKSTTGDKNTYVNHFLATVACQIFIYNAFKMLTTAQFI